MGSTLSLHIKFISVLLPILCIGSTLFSEINLSLDYHLSFLRMLDRVEPDAWMIDMYVTGAPIPLHLYYILSEFFFCTTSYFSPFFLYC